jgi:hypothetical protein
MPRGPRGAYWVEAAILAFVLAAVAWLASGCGASAQVRAAYAVEQAQCVANERAIVDRPGTTEAEDRADLAAERARCDETLRSIEGGGSDVP